MTSANKRFLLWVVGLGVLFPLFFQLDSGVYNDVKVMMDSQGALTKLPLPISILTCFAVLALLPGNIHRVRPGLAMTAGVIVASLISLWLGGDGVTPQQRKMLMILQVLLPVAGLLLGQLIEDQGKTIARAFLVVLSVVVSLQLLATWLQDSLMLTHYMYVFSIYSHLQYVPLVLVCAYAYSLTSLWDEHKIWLSVIALPMLIYVIAGLSFLSISAYILVLLVFSVGQIWAHRKSRKLVFIALVLLATAVAGGVLYFGKIYDHGTSSRGDVDFFEGKFKRLSEGHIPSNLQERFGDWQLFGKGILESKKTILVGHPQPMPREIRSSPHNWYIDMAYTFGLVALLPILTLIGYTAYLCWRQRKTLSAQTWWLAVIVFYLVVVDSNFKVTLRQPYPGIFAYFLWGLLLSRLRPTTAPRSGA